MNQRIKHISFFVGTFVLLVIHSHFFYTRLAANSGQLDTESSQIEVINLSNVPIYVATYCKNVLGNGTTRTSPLKAILPNSTEKFARPESSVKCTRSLMFSQDPEALASYLSNAEAKTIGSTGIGSTSGGILASSFYITSENGVLKGYSSLNYKTKDTLTRTKALLRTFYDTELQMALQKSLHFKEDKHQFDVAQVRISDQIPQEEANFVRKRKSINKIALEKLLGKKLNGSYVPSIAMVSSGGGARALICSLGMHVGAQETGLLDCITYDVGLSGGSWFVSLWQQSQLTPSEFKKRMQPIMARGLNPAQAKNFSLSEIQNILNGLMFRKAAQQPVTLVTLWGAMLANRYLSPYAPYSQDIFFSELYERIADAQMPFPILTAVNGRYADLGVNLEKAEWFEFTPLEAGGIGNWLGNAHIPMWSLGRTFKENASIDTKAEYDLGQLIGICGSAFAFTMGRAFAETVGKINMRYAYTLTQTLGEELVSLKRVSVGKVPNFTKDIPDSIVKDFEDLRLVDAGMSFNIPVPAVLHSKRKADIIIVMDASGGEIGKALQLTQAYASNHNLPFPGGSYDSMETQALNIFESNDSATPTIIHLSRVVDRARIKYPSIITKDYSTNISTGQFQYTAKEFNQLSAATQANVTESIEAIKEAITRNIELHGGFAK